MKRKGKGANAPPAPGGRNLDDVADRGRGSDSAAREGDALIGEWRRRIDLIDDQLMRLLNSRSACAVEIGKIKRALGLPVYSPDREAWILDRVAQENPGPLDSTAIRRVFERIIDESRRLERIAAQEDERTNDGNPGRD